MQLTFPLSIDNENQNVYNHTMTERIVSKNEESILQELNVGQIGTKKNGKFVMPS